MLLLAEAFFKTQSHFLGVRLRVMTGNQNFFSQITYCILDF